MQNNLLDNREKIASRLKEARTASGLSQDEAAIRIGLKRPAISEIEAGRRKVTAEEIIQFAMIYKVDKSWLLLEELDEENQELKFAAREWGKLSTEDRKKLLKILKILPK